MTYSELTDKIYQILHHMFGADATLVSEALSLEEAFEADSLDKADMVNQIWGTLHVDITDNELKTLQAHDGYTGIMIITYINFVAKKLNIEIPSDRRQYEFNMRALKINQQSTKTKRATPVEMQTISESLQEIGETIERVNRDTVRRAQILNQRIRYNAK